MAHTPHGQMPEQMPQPMQYLSSEVYSTEPSSCSTRTIAPSGHVSRHMEQSRQVPQEMQRCTSSLASWTRKRPRFCAMNSSLLSFSWGDHHRFFRSHQRLAREVIVDVLGNFAATGDGVGQKSRLDGVAEGENAGERVTCQQSLTSIMPRSVSHSRGT